MKAYKDLCRFPLLAVPTTFTPFACKRSFICCISCWPPDWHFSTQLPQPNTKTFSPSFKEPTISKRYEPYHHTLQVGNIKSCCFFLDSASLRHLSIFTPLGGSTSLVTTNCPLFSSSLNFDVFTNPHLLGYFLIK